MNEQSYIFLNELEQQRASVNFEIRKIQTQQTEPGGRFGESRLSVKWQNKVNELKREERRLSRASRIMARLLLYKGQ
jgi:hypothetical protein